MNRVTIACRVLPDRAGRPRVAYLTGWTIGDERPGWTYDHTAPAVLRGTEHDGRIWLDLLRRDGIQAQAMTEGG